MIQQIVISEKQNSQPFGEHILPMDLVPVIPENEIERNELLTHWDLDYSAFRHELKDLLTLASKVTGASVALVNLIDSFTVWNIAGDGFPVTSMEREESVCQYTILSKKGLEIKNLAADKRFKDRFYVAGEPHLKYYYGVPLRVQKDLNIGTLCVMDASSEKAINHEQEVLLGMIAEEVVKHLVMYAEIKKLKRSIREVNETQKRLAHDIRGPLGGIISLTQIVSMMGDEAEMEKVLEFMGMIEKSGRSLIELADEILTSGKPKSVKKEKIDSNEFNLAVLKDKLEKLFTPQAMHKNIRFSVNIKNNHEKIPFPKNKLMQIAGNLISNAIKFTPHDGRVVVELMLDVTDEEKKIHILVKDTGIGLDDHVIQHIQNGDISSSNGTDGETGYGLGLSLVKHLVDGLNGTMNISSLPGEGAVFEVKLPQK